MNKIPVIAFKNKVKKDRYLAASMDVGDWDDPELDVHISDIENAFIICRKDLSKPDGSDIENVIAESKWHIKYMREKFGENAVVTFDVEKWLQFYEPVSLEITKRQYQQALQNLS